MPTSPFVRRARHAASSALDSALVSAARRAGKRFDVSARANRCTRELSLTLAAVLLIGVGAASADPTAPPAAPASIAAATSLPSPVPSPERAALQLADRTPDLPAPVTEQAAPSVVAPAQAPAAPATAERWLPTGTGMWLHDWRRSESGHASEVVARSKATGLSHLFVQTGSSKKGWIGEEVLSQLMPATAGTGIKVIAWDFPKLDDPEADARRLARAAWWNRKGAPMVAAVAPDVETAAEGTDLRGDRVERYYKELRRALPARTAILATVPWPSEKRTGMYPYATTAPYTDAWIPMAYWYNRSPSVVTKTSMQWLKQFGKPVMPVGQGYDGRLDVPYLKEDPHPDKSVAAFIYVAREQGAQSLSLWSWQTTGPLQWGELAKAAGKVGPQPATQPAAEPAVAVAPAAEPAEQTSGSPAKRNGAETAEERSDRSAQQKAPAGRRDRHPAATGAER